MPSQAVRMLWRPNTISDQSQNDLRLARRRAVRLDEEGGGGRVREGGREVRCWEWWQGRRPSGKAGHEPGVKLALWPSLAWQQGSPGRLRTRQAGHGEGERPGKGEARKVAEWRRRAAGSLGQQPLARGYPADRAVAEAAGWQFGRPMRPWPDLTAQPGFFAPPP
ncbi:hypothetical protein NL676_001972 [Syzygium grande]|nr:hypothetical protein NL676_001972 [Syzygium grande]